jgi:hypothetical protein
MLERTKGEIKLEYRKKVCKQATGTHKLDMAEGERSWNPERK